MSHGIFLIYHTSQNVVDTLTADARDSPLALAFGEASGAGPIAGIWRASFIGFFATRFGAGLPTLHNRWSQLTRILGSLACHTEWHNKL